MIYVCNLLTRQQITKWRGGSKFLCHSQDAPLWKKILLGRAKRQRESGRGGKVSDNRTQRGKRRYQRGTPPQRVKIERGEKRNKMEKYASADVVNPTADVLANKSLEMFQDL